MQNDDILQRPTLHLYADMQRMSWAKPSPTKLPMAIPTALGMLTHKT